MNRARILVVLLLIIVGGVVINLIIPGGGLLWPGGPNLLQNGSFEDGSFVATDDESIKDTNSMQLCGGSSSLDDWQIIYSVWGTATQGGTTSQDCSKWTSPSQVCHSDIDAVSWLQSPNKWYLDAVDGHRFLDLTGYQARPPGQFGGVSQKITNLQPGSKYELSYSIGSSSTPQFQPTNIGVCVLFGGISKDGMITASPTSDVSHWETHTTELRANDSTMTLTFLGTGGPQSSGNYLGLDAVSLRKKCFLPEAVLFGCWVPNYPGKKRAGPYTP
jgi:hypothetical protein